MSGGVREKRTKPLMHTINKILVVVNPASSDNAGERAWSELEPAFKSAFSTKNYSVAMPSSKEQSTELAATTDADLIISVSGDGAIHNIAQGIMLREKADRPALAVIPVGSGNDFAMSLGLPKDPRQAIEAISKGDRVSIDVGQCNDIIYMETLSFGIDAAIANQTMEARKTSKSRGLMLYAGVAISAIVRELKKHRYLITFEDGQVQDMELLICAVQNGPTYGGGFRVSPDALINDGLLNMCMATNTGKIHALYALALMSKGKHEGLKIFSKKPVRKLTIETFENIPAQCDGEEIFGRRFEVKVIPNAIDVIVSKDAAIVTDSQKCGES